MRRMKLRLCQNDGKNTYTQKREYLDGLASHVMSVICEMLAFIGKREDFWRLELNGNDSFYAEQNFHHDTHIKSTLIPEFSDKFLKITLFNKSKCIPKNSSPSFSV